MVHAHFAVMYCYKIFASSVGAHPPPALSSSLRPNGCVVVIYLPGTPPPPPFKIAGSAPDNIIDRDIFRLMSSGSN